MCQVDVISSPITEARIATRATVHGPEADLLARYLESKLTKLQLSNVKSNYVVFLEPLIDSGYPDAVLIRYDKRAFDRWCEAREKLSCDDLKMLIYLQRNQPTTCSDVSRKLGFGEPEVERCFNILLECGISLESKGQWRTVGKSKYLGVKSITSIEAKVASTQIALDQATSNKRFSSESYVLSGSTRITDRTRDLFERRGVGLIGGDCKTRLVEPKKNPLPETHVMLRFNEWIGRCITLGVIA